MLKHLVKHGNSLALILDKPILDLLKIDDRTLLEIETDGQNLSITPIRTAEDRARLTKAIIAKASKHYAPLLKRLPGK